MAHRSALSFVMALLLGVSLLPPPTAAQVAPDPSPSVLQSIQSGFPKLASLLTPQAELTAANRLIDGQSIAGLAATGKPSAPPAGLKAEERAAWLAARGRDGDGSALAPFFPSRFTDPFVVEGGGVSVTLRPVGAHGVAAREENGTVVYRNAYDHTDSIHIIERSQSKEFLLLQSPTAPTRFVYEITAVSGAATVAMVDGAIHFNADNGGGLRIAAPWVMASGSTERQTAPVHWELSEPNAAGIRHLTLNLNPAGLAYPLVIDPWFFIGPGNYPLNLFTRRMEHTATPLNNGMVLVAGGRVSTGTGNDGDATFTTELYNPLTGTWATTGNMSRPRMNHTATLLPNGKVLVVGGFNGSDNQLTAAEIYNPDTGTWSTAGNTQYSRERHTATLLHHTTGDSLDAYVLIAGGRNNPGGLSVSTNTAELYHVRTGNWTTTNPMAGSREKHTATLLPDGQVIVIGGVQVAGSTPPQTYITLSTVEIFNPTTRLWAPANPMATARERHTASLVITNPHDGTNPPTTVYPRTNTYEVLVIGGCNGDPTAITPCTTALDSTERYSVAGGAWSGGFTLPRPTHSARNTVINPAPPPTGARYDHTATVLPSGEVFIWGGRDSYDDGDPSGQFGTQDSLSLITSVGYHPITGQLWQGISRIAGDGTPARHAHSATLMANGQVLIVGGFNRGGFLIPQPGSNGMPVEDHVYDPAEGYFVNVPSTLPSARRDHTATLLQNGKVLVVGGTTNGTDALTSAALYTPQTNTWTPTGNLNVKRYGHTVTLLPNGKVLVVGGLGDSISIQSTEIYDPASGQWTTTGNPASQNSPAVPPSPGCTTTPTELCPGNLATARYEHTATILMNGQILVAGGNNSNTGYTATAELYNPSTGRWSTTGGLTLARARHTATLLPDGKVLVAGGFNDRDISTDGNSTGSAERYNPTTQTWSSAGSHAPRWNHTATLLPNGRVLIAGGRSAGTLNSGQLYDYATNGWAGTGAGMIAFREDHTATLLINGQVLITGGLGQVAANNPPDTAGPLASVELYLPNMNRFVPTKIEITGTGADNWQASRYPGPSNCDPLDITFPKDDCFSSSTNMNARRYSHTATLLPDSRVLIAGGFNNTAGSLNTSETYDHGLGYADHWRPTIDANSVSLVVGQPMNLTGKGFRGTAIGADVFRGSSEASGGNGSQNSATNVPMLVVMSLANEQARMIPINSAAGWSNTSYVSQAIGSFPPGFALVSIITNGIPSKSEFLDAELTSTGATTWYFAEGYTGTGFDEYLTIQNPNIDDAQLEITYYLASGAPIVKNITVLASSRYTVVVHDTAEGVGRNQAVSAKVASTNGVGIVVERPMYFNYGGSLGSATGGHNVMGVQAPRTTWLFAEGYTGTGFDEYLTIMNPNGGNAAVRITYYLSGAAPVVKDITVLANSRYTVVVHDTAEGVGRNQAVSVKVETTNGLGIVVERPIYFRYGGSISGGVTGGHNVMGAAGPQGAWYFPEGNTNTNWDEYLTLMNTFSQDSLVKLTYYIDGTAMPVEKNIVVPANSRYTVVVHDTVEGVGRGKKHGTKVETTNGVDLVVERPMYFRYNTSIDGGHDIMGAFAPDQTWLFAEGYTGTGFDEFLIVLNPNTTAANVTITYYLSTGLPVAKTLTVNPRARSTINVHDAAQVGRNQAVSAKVETTHTGGVVVERPMYFNYNGSLPNLNGGHTVMGYTP